MLEPELSACPGAVFDNHILSERSLILGAIKRAMMSMVLPGGKRNHDADRLRRVLLGREPCTRLP